VVGGTVVVGAVPPFTTVVDVGVVTGTVVTVVVVVG